MRVCIRNRLGRSAPLLAAFLVSTAPHAWTQVVPWTDKAALPQSMGSFAIGAIGSKIVVSGGTAGTATFAYDTAANTWQSGLAALPAPTEYAGTNGAVIGGILYAVGGASGGVCTGNNFAFDLAANSWSAKAPLPTPRCHLGVAATGGKVYALGGTNTAGSFVYGNVERYDPGTNSWTTVAPMPTPRTHFAVSELNGLLYAIGGNTAAGVVSAAVEAYDPATNTWAAKAPLPTARLMLAVSAVNGVLLATGGFLAPGPAVETAVVEFYDPVANAWRSGVPLDHPRGALRSATVSGAVYVLGGGSNAATTKYVEAYRPWRAQPSLTQAKANFAAGAVGNRIVLAGGNGSGNQTATQIYDPAAKTWSAGPALPAPTEFAGTNGAVVGDVLFAIGGNSGGFCTSNNWAYSANSGTWSARAPMPTARCHLGVVAVLGKIYAMGGTNTAGSLVYGHIERYDPATDTWSVGPFAPMPTPRTHLALCAFGGKVYAIGGNTASGAVSAAVEEYDPATNTWAVRAPLPTPRLLLGAAAVGGRIAAIGGMTLPGPSGETGVVELFDPLTNAWTHDVPMPTARGGLAAITSDGAVHALGGGSNAAAFAAHETYSCGTPAYGAGCPGSGGFVPRLGLSGCTTPGGSVTLEVEHGLGGAPALLLFGTGQAMLPMGGTCQLLAAPLLPASLALSLSGAGPGAGTLKLTAPLAESLTIPVTFTAQLLVADPGAGPGFTASNGIKITLD